MEKTINMRQTINKFIEDNQRGFTRGGEKITKGEIKLFFKKDEKNKDDKFDKEFDADEIRDMLIDILKKVRNKKKRYYTFSEYIKYLNKEEQMCIKRLPIYYSEFERRLEIIKKIQEGRNSDDLFNMADEFLVDVSIIHKDIKALEFGALDVSGQHLQIDYREKNNQEYITSTAHPLFLVENLEQIIAILNGLYHSYQDYGYKEYVKETAVSIWMQLSDYAKERILGTLPEILNLNMEWYEMISKEAEKRKLDLLENASCDQNHFKTEEFISKLGRDKEADYLKMIKNRRNRK